MNETVYTIIQDLNKSYPLPAQTLTLPQVCEVLSGVKLKTIQNNISLGKCPFPVVRVMGKVMVSKHVLARVIAGLDPFEEVDKKTKVGRPKNSERLKRFVCMTMQTIFDDYNNQRLQRLHEEQKSLMHNINMSRFEPRIIKHL